MTFESLAINLLVTGFYGLVLCAVVEGACDYIFSWSLFERKFDGKGYKWWVAMGVSLATVHIGQYDAIHMVQGLDATQGGMILSFGLIAGGSKKLAERFGSIRKAATGVQYTTTAQVK